MSCYDKEVFAYHFHNTLLYIAICYRKVCLIKASKWHWQGGEGQKIRRETILNG